MPHASFTPIHRTLQAALRRRESSRLQGFAERYGNDRERVATATCAHTHRNKAENERYTKKDETQLGSLIFV